MTERTTERSGSNEDKSKQLNLKNTAIKFLLDQTVGAGVNVSSFDISQCAGDANTTAQTVLFIIGMALIRGDTFASAAQELSEQFWPIVFAGQKLWPFVSLISFTLVPLEYRMLLGNSAGLVWGIYLSLMAGEAKTET